jgi:hypothetical protein
VYANRPATEREPDSRTTRFGPRANLAETKSGIYLEGPFAKHIRGGKHGLEVTGVEGPAPPFDLSFDRILVSSHNRGTVSFAALEMMSTWGISLDLIGKAGTTIASFTPQTNPDAERQLAQMRCALNPRRQLQVARAFVEAKIGGPTQAPTLPQLLTEEGKHAEEYWARLGVKRKSRFYGGINGNNSKAVEPTNAAINWAQGINAAKWRLAIAKVGLSPYIGMLHRTRSGKEAFVYDCQELTREVFDRAAINFANAQTSDWTVRGSDFVYRLTPEATRNFYRFLNAAVLSRNFGFGRSCVALDTFMVRTLRGLSNWFQEPTENAPKLVAAIEG